MCRACYLDYGEPYCVNVSVAECLRLVRALYEVSPAGGPAHIVADDWNVADENIAFCLEACKDPDYDLVERQAAEEFLTAFQQLSEDERVTVLALQDHIVDPP